MAGITLRAGRVEDPTSSSPADPLLPALRPSPLARCAAAAPRLPTTFYKEGQPLQDLATVFARTQQEGGPGTIEVRAGAGAGRAAPGSPAALPLTQGLVR